VHPLHFYSVNESAKLRNVHYGLPGKCDPNIPETRSVDSSDQTVQELASSLISQVNESRETDAFFWQRRQAEVVIVGRKGKEIE